MKIGSVGKAAAIGLCLLGTVVFGGTLVMADGFYPGANDMDCEFAQTESIAAESLPVGGDVEGGMVYEMSAVKGERGHYASGHTLLDLAEVRYPNARRYKGRADSLEVPPGTMVEIGFFPFNFAGHNVTLSSGFLYLTNSDQTGSFARLGASGSAKNITFKIGSVNVVRRGLGVEVGALGTWPVSSYSNPPKGRKIYGFTVAQPIVFDVPVTKYSVNGVGELIVHVDQKVKNDSEYDLDVTYIHQNYSATGKIFANGEITYSYDVNLGTNYQLNIDLGYPKVSVLTRSKECIASGGDTIINYDPDSRVLFSARDDDSAPPGWHAYQTDFAYVPSGATMCITRIPYQINSTNIRLVVSPVLSLNANLSHSSEANVKIITVESGEKFEAEIKVGNGAVRADNVEVKFDQTGWQVEGSRCQVVSNGEGKGVWDIGQMGNGGEVVCDINGVGQNTGSDVVDVPIGVSVCSNNMYCQNEVLHVSILPSISVRVSKTASKGVVKMGNTLEFVVRVDNAGNTLRGVKLVDECSGCGVLKNEEVSSEKLVLSQAFDIPMGVYTILLKYDVGEGNSRELNNCARLINGGGNVIAESCVKVNYIGSESEVVLPQPVVPVYSPLFPPTIDTTYFPDLVARNAGYVGTTLEIVDSALLPKIAENKLAYTGTNVILPITVVAGCYVIFMKFVIAKRFW